jgi:anti-sigma regulatory factor (Ser/Thr protein kinase)
VTVTLERQLAVSPRAVPEARDAVDELEGVPPKVIEDMRLLISELVTNSIRHTGLGPEDELSLSIRALASTVRVEVSDSGPGFSGETHAPTLYQQSGWGLFLVEELSTRWGVDRQGDRTLVWFELDWGPARPIPTPA